MSEWKEYKLGDICDITSSRRIFLNEYVKEGVPFYRSKEIIEKAKGNNISTELFITNERYGEIKRKNFVPVENDILITSVGTLGVSYMLSKKDFFYFKDGNLTWLRNYSNLVYPKYLLYWLRSNIAKEKFNEISIGSTQPAITIQGLKGLQLKLPKHSTQTAIAEILSSLDDKIELNNKINQELETLAQTLFKQWFIDFEFPNENGEPYKSSGGEMVDSELGEIPKGWEIEVLSEATKLIRGISYRKPELVLKGEGIAFVNLKCFSLNGTFRQDGIKYYNGKYKNEQILSKNDILVAVTDLTQDREIIGMPILWNGSTTALPSLDTCIIRSETSELKNFLYYEFKTKRYKSRIIEHANGSTVLHLSVKGLETYVFPLPNDKILKNWCGIIQPILETINSNINEIYELSKTRDTLLPKLISGELEINEITN